MSAASCGRRPVRLTRPRSRGSSMLEAVLAVTIATAVLTSAGEQARTACVLLREAREIAAATTAARNVLDAVLATPCADPETAIARCTAPLRCTLAAREIARRTGSSGVVVVMHVEVSVQPAAESQDERVLVRAAGASARPEACA